MTDKPTIELMKLKIASHLSEETTAYSAEVYVDGKFFCFADNHGTGGPDRFTPDYDKENMTDFNERLKELDERIAAHYPPLTYNGQNLGSANLEIMIGRLMDQYEIDKSIRNKLTRNWVFRHGDTIREMKRNKGEDANKVLIVINERFPGAQLLNKLSLPEVREAYEACGLLEAA